MPSHNNLFAVLRDEAPATKTAEPPTPTTSKAPVDEIPSYQSSTLSWDEVEEFEEIKSKTKATATKKTPFKASYTSSTSHAREGKTFVLKAPKPKAPRPSKYTPEEQAKMYAYTDCIGETHYKKFPWSPKDKLMKDTRPYALKRLGKGN